MSILEQIRLHYAQMTKVHRKIADYITEHYNTLAFTKLEDLAEQIGVSTASVIRFSRLLGYPGYTALQQKIQTGLVKKVSLPERLDDSMLQVHTDDIVADVYATSLQHLQDTVDSLDPAALQQATSAVIGAARVFVFGSRTTYGLAHYMVASLSLLHRDVRLVSGVGGIYPEEVVGCREGDVCIAFMFPRYQKMMSNMIGWMRQRGVRIILFTSPEYESVAHLGDIFLCLHSQRTATKDSLVPTAFAADCLLTSVMAHGDYCTTRGLSEDMEELLDRGVYLGL